MQIQDWGEKGFIQHLINQFSVTGNLVGIGDDCAVIPAENGKAWLITTDALVEGVHFLKNQIPASEIGYKAVAVNVSDIAAMGGEPRYAFLTVAIPNNIDSKWMKDMTQGIKKACEKWGILLLGGDTVNSKKDLFLSLTLIGSATESHIKYRHMAIPGDIICLNGYLGESGGGFKALQMNTPQSQKLIDAHFHPQPSPEEGKWIASHDEVHAMMDVSDGLNCDLHCLLTSSKCGGVVEITNLPISKTLLCECIKNGWNAIELALTGGEDYCLLFTVTKKSFKTLQKSFHKKFGKLLYEIGWVTDQVNQLSYQKHRQPIQMQLTDFQHFKESK